MIRFVIVNTSTFPQLPFQFNAKMNSIQCYINATRVSYPLSSSSSSSEDFSEVDNELDAFATDLEKREVQQYLNVLHEETGLEGMEIEDYSIADAVKNETFGMMNIIDELTDEVHAVLDRLRKACKDGEKMAKE